ncbi:hypothetical protein R69749_07518 [Paraburkholderia domus]|nr:hypothetical protein R69749_07518 [Paraburkholderia domus]
MSEQVRVIWGRFVKLAANAQLSPIAVWKKESRGDGTP